MKQSNNAVYVEALNCWYHEACLPAFAPRPTRVLDMNDPATVGNNPYLLCSTCLNLLIVSNGRITQELMCQDMTHALTFAEKCVGCFVCANGVDYKIIYAFIQPDEHLTRGRVVAVLEALPSDKTTVYEQVLQMVRLELKQTPATVSVGSVLSLIDECIGPDTLQEEAYTVRVQEIMHRVLDEAFPVAQEA